MKPDLFYSEGTKLGFLTSHEMSTVSLNKLLWYLANLWRNQHSIYKVRWFHFVPALAIPPTNTSLKTTTPTKLLMNISSEKDLFIHVVVHDAATHHGESCTVQRILRAWNQHPTPFILPVEKRPMLGTQTKNGSRNLQDRISSQTLFGEFFTPSQTCRITTSGFSFHHDSV